MSNTLFILTWPIRKLLLLLIIGIRPLLGPANCRFYVSCSKYAIQKLEQEPLHKAIWSICKRLLACCNPFE